MTIPIPEVDPSACCHFLSIEELAKILLNKDGSQTLPARFRALFALKNLGGEDVIPIMGEAFADPSALLKHELAYCMGQMGLTSANPFLARVLADKTQDAMVRHEAAEALGAVGSPENISILEMFLGENEDRAVRETCEISIDRIKRNEFSEPLMDHELEFGSVDPAPSLKKANVSIAQLRDLLMDKSGSLYERYKAMFALRNRGHEKGAVLALCDGFADDSALFRHEIAYVLGQLKHPASIPALKEVLARPHEIAMVRHEAAEALGSIATDECNQFLSKYVTDEEAVVKESCLVALDMIEYENSEELAFFPCGNN